MSDREEGRHSGTPSYQKELLCCCQKAGTKGQALEAPIGDSVCGLPLSVQGGHPQNLQKPGPSGTHQ